jgi:hypothetical protein
MAVVDLAVMFARLDVYASFFFAPYIAPIYYCLAVSREFFTSA